MLFEKLFDLLVGCKPALARGLEASPDACKLFRRRMIFAGAKSGIDLKCKFSAPLTMEVRSKLMDLK